ncbi:uncharacterized protein [Henckelia pumila]|uniref:uncharacterized protein n=1 Tax=Henckelia pumila TaxID=405737 RepID=UPI003C6DF908
MSSNSQNFSKEDLSTMIREAMRAELETMHERISKLEVSEYDESFGENSGRNRRGQDDGRNRREAMRGRYTEGGREDGNINGIKMKIPSFNGKSDPEAYLEWEMRVESVFDCHNYNDSKKIKLAVVKFVDYALIWWDQLTTSRRRNRERSIETWEEMKQIMKKRFVPNYYYRDMFKRLKNLKQGSRSVEDYYKELEITMIRANIEEDSEATVARFLCGLNRDIHDQVELRHCVDLEEMVQLTMKVELQLKRRGIGRVSSGGGTTTPWHPNVGKREDVKPGSGYYKSCNLAIQLNPKEFLEDQLGFEILSDMAEKKCEIAIEKEKEIFKDFGDALMRKQRRYNIKSLNMLDPCEGEVECLKVVLFERYDLDANQRYNFNTNFQRYEFNSMLHGFNYFVEGFEKVLAINYALSSNLDVKSLEFVHTTRVGYLVYVDMCECCKNSIGGKSYLPDWLLLTFGLTNVRNTFMGLMGCVFHASMGNFIVIYFDFILVYSKIFKVHVEHYGIVLIMLGIKFLGHEHVRNLNVFCARELVDFGVSSHGFRVVGEALITYQRGHENVVVTTLSPRYIIAYEKYF